MGLPGRSRTGRSRSRRRGRRGRSRRARPGRFGAAPAKAFHRVAVEGGDPGGRVGHCSPRVRIVAAFDGEESAAGVLHLHQAASALVSVVSAERRRRRPRSVGICHEDERFVMNTIGILVGAGVLALTGFSASAQEVTGVLGSPAATTTSRQSASAANPAFGGVIKESASEFDALVASARRAAEERAERAPHHDRRPGFRRAGHVRRGRYRPPNMDRIADAGLRYTNFHSTSLCSPTRAAIITGRNHHSVGFGVVVRLFDALSRLRFRSYRSRKARSVPS